VGAFLAVYFIRLDMDFKMNIFTTVQNGILTSFAMFVAPVGCGDFFVCRG
jgi:hypothetical protein